MLASKESRLERKRANTQKRKQTGEMRTHHLDKGKIGKLNATKLPKTRKRAKALAEESQGNSVIVDGKCITHDGISPLGSADSAFRERWL